MSGETPASLALRDYIAVAVINVMWGLNIVAVKMAVDATAPLAAAGLRLLIVFAACLPFLRVVSGRMGAVIAVALLQGAMLLLFVNLALRVADNVTALAISGQLNVPFALILAVLFLGERIAFARLLGIVLSFAGVALLVFDPGVADEVPGLLLSACGSLSWAIGSLFQRRLTGVPVLTVYAWMGAIGAPLMLAASYAAEPSAFAALPALPLKSLGWIAFSAIGCTVLGHGGLAWLLQRHELSAVMPLTMPSPVIGVVASVIIFGTALTGPMIAGGMIALTGVAIITIRSARPRGQAA